MHHFICFPKDTVLPGKEFSNRTTLFRESCTFGKVKDISEWPFYSLKQKQNHEQRGRSTFPSGRAAVSVGSYTSRLAANKSQDWAIKVLVHSRKMTCYWQLIVSNSSSHSPNLSCVENRLVAIIAQKEMNSFQQPDEPSSFPHWVTRQRPVLFYTSQQRNLTSTTTITSTTTRKTSFLQILLASPSLPVKTTTAKMYIKISLFPSRATPT